MIDFNSEQTNQNFNHYPSESISPIHLKIKRLYELKKDSKLTEEIFIDHLMELKMISSAAVKHFNEQKKRILQRFDTLIMPIAKEILENLLKDADKLKDRLHRKLDSIDQMSEGDWEKEMGDWEQLDRVLLDSNMLIDKVLETITHRTRFLIDKDIQVIKDYQNQSLGNLSKESEAFKNTEQRLAHAIEEPLKQLIALRNQTNSCSSIQQASDWVAKVSQQRENYFDQLLLKIDLIMKDVVQGEEVKDWTLFLDIEGEVLFIERELHHLHEDLTHLHLMQDSDKQFIFARLEGILDHIEQLSYSTLPDLLHQRIESLKESIRVILSRYQT